MQFKLSYYAVASEPFQTQEQKIQRLVFSGRTAKTLEISDTLWWILQRSDFDSLPSSTIEELRGAKIIVERDENELEEILASNDQAGEDSDTLYQVVQPTMNCQFGCSYCSQQFFSKSISLENQTRLIASLRQRLAAGNYKRLSIGWFGSEPLMATGPALIRHLTKEFQNLASEFNCAYSAKLVTNGLALKAPLARELAQDFGISRFEITLDGSAEYHDKRRNLKNSVQGTYEIILNNLVEMAAQGSLPNGAIISIRSNVDGRNKDGVLPLLHDLHRRGLHHFIGYWYPAAVHDWGNEAGQESLSKEAFAELEMTWLAEAITLGIPISLLPKRSKVVCMATNHHASMTDGYGNVFGCTEYSYLKAYGLGQGGETDGATRDNSYVIGSLAEGIYPDRDQRKGSFLDWNDGIRRAETPCHQCPMLPVCGGGCPKSWREGGHPCPSFKYNLHQRLLLSYAKQRMEAAATIQQA
jgi:uncharacterized protein